MQNFTLFKVLRNIIVGGIFLVSFHPANLEITWLDDFQKAQALAQEQNKPILMVFSGSDWCKPCILLEKEVFKNQLFQQFAQDKLILLKLDFPRRRKNELSSEIKIQHETLAETYNPEGAFPRVMLLDKSGKILGIINHQSNQTEEFVNQIKSLMDH
ncbi:MAG: thioredoxin family protein [Microscillaceae bacterium]|nr:thioredoxin family protein [Microscillaceae bacterium]